jgi:tetratricopeptide (TPR) repeat protein
MVKKTRTGKQSSTGDESIEELLQQRMRAEGLLLPLSEADVRHAEIEIESLDEALPPTLYDFQSLMRRARTYPLAHKRSIIIVMPFTTLSAEEDSNYFSEMADIISANLSDYYPHFIVSPFDAASDNDAGETGAPLDADFTVRGHVKLVCERIEAIVQLRSERDDATFWERVYERPRDDIMLLEDQIAEDIAHALIPTLERKNDPRVIRRRRPALDGYLGHRTWNEFIRNYFFDLGHNAWNKLTEDGLLEAVTHYRKATSIDPEFAQSDASTADCFLYLGLLGLIPSDKAYTEARKFAQAALDKDELRASVHTSLGFTEMFYEWQWEKAELSFNDALTLDSEYPLAHIGYAQLLAGMGRFDEALAQIEEALKSDPTPLSEVVRAMILFEARQPELALEHLLRAKETYRNFDQIYYVLALVNVELGNFKEAMKMARRAVVLSDHNHVKRAHRIYVLIKAGNIGEALVLLKELLRPDIKELPSPDRAAHSDSSFHLAAIYVALAEKDDERREEYRTQAIIHLRHACQKKDQFIFLLRVDPRFDSIRLDMRFIELLRNVKLEPAKVAV